METNWAGEHLQTIRTLMERSAVYRRALAPIMIYVGALGVAGTVIGWTLLTQEDHGFILFWGAVAVIALGGSFLLVRRQALKDAEPFWSPPTRRVATAMLPALCFGAFVAFVLYLLDARAQEFLPPLWMALYGCALHAAGFFMPRGIKLLGWAFVFFACGYVACQYFFRISYTHPDPLAGGHAAMGASFGLLHLAYGGYLYFTEKGKNAT